MPVKYFFVFILLSTVLSVRAQHLKDTLHLQEVIIRADRFFKKENAGMKETRVDSLILLQKMNLSLSELLSENTSVFIKSMGRGALATASFRGTAASHTQVSWNGININSPMIGMVDFSLIPVYIIDDMNLKHGTASISDQSGGLGGSVSINNTVDWNKPFGVKYMQGFGSYSTFNEFLQLNAGNKKLQSKTRLYQNYSKNDYTFINHGIANIDPKTGNITNPPDTNDNASYKLYGILQEVYFKLNNSNIFSAKWWGQGARRTIPRATSYEGPDNSNLNRQEDYDNKLVAEWKHLNPKSKTLLRTGYSQKELNYYLMNFVPGYGSIPAIYSKSRQKSSYNSLSYSYDFNDKLSIEGKLDANFHDVVSNDSVKKTGYAKQRNEQSAFLSVRKNFANRLNINLMLREDRVDGQFTPVIPYAGFDFKLFKNKDLLLKGNIARNYHEPSLNDMYWQPGGNPDLEPEQGISIESGIEFQQAISKYHKIKTELTAYRSDIDNWIIWIPSYKGYWEPRNIQRVLSQGVEVNIQLDGYLGKVGYKINGNYAYTRSVNYGDQLVWGDESYGKQLVYIPLHSGNVMVNLSYRRFFITYQNTSYSERYTTSSNDVTRRDWLYPYYMNDLILGKDLTIKKLSLSVEIKIYNLFNETYHSVLYRPMPKRNYLVQLMFKI